MLRFAATAFVVSLVCTYLLVRVSARFGLVDYPNERSLHSAPVPRSGGVAILLGGLTAIFYLLTAQAPINPSLFVAAGFPMLLIAGASMIDDVSGLSVSTRLVVHLIAATLGIYLGLAPDVLRLPGWQSPVLGIGSLVAWLLFLVWMTNLYNFMDGMDGFSGGMAVIGFGTFGYLAWIAQAPEFMILSFIVAAATAGFLLFNFPPAKIFMGDTGSSSLGFLAAAFSLWAEAERIFPLWTAVLIFSPFIADASITLIRRLVRREQVWTPHKTHYYQRLIQLGWSHRRTTLTGYAVMALCAASAVYTSGRSAAEQWLVISCFLGFYWLVTVIIKNMERRNAVEPLRNEGKR